MSLRRDTLDDGNAREIEAVVDSEPDIPLSSVQEQLMAYLDDEMDDSQRREFEAVIAADTDLQREVQRFRGVLELTETLTLPEPTDHERRRFWSDFYNRSEWQVGWFLILTGAAVLCGWGLWSFLSVDWIPSIVKIAVASTVVGLGLLIGNTVRLQQRVSRYDRYKGVQR